MTLNISPICAPIQTVHGAVVDPTQAPPSRLNRNKRGVALPDKTWPQHSILNISLLNMTQEQKVLVKQNINQWAPHTNLYFKFTDRPDGDVRITADKNATSGWSTIGTDAKKVPLSKPTASIGFKGSPSEIAAQIQHEFGHTLGLKHEHQHPERTLELNKPNIYEEFESRGKFAWVADQQIIQTLAHAAVHISPYDQKSIMHYGFPTSRLSNGEPISRNSQLSEGDKQFMESLYPEEKSTLGKLLNTTIRAMINA